MTVIVLLGLVANVLMCGRAFGKGMTNTATEWLMATQIKLAMAWVTWVLIGVAVKVEMRATLVQEIKRWTPAEWKVVMWCVDTTGWIVLVWLE